MNIFIIETELQALGAVGILKQVKGDSYIFTRNLKLKNYLSERCETPISIMNREHRGGWLGKAFYIWRCIFQVSKVLAGCKSVDFYMSRMDSVYNNSIYSYFSKGMKTSFHMTPDGSLNYFCGATPTEKILEMKKWRSRLSLLTFGKVPITLFYENELGGELAESVCCLGGVKPGWASDEQVMEIEFPIDADNVKNDGDILIIGQNLKYYKLVDDVLFNRIQGAIERLVDYLPSRKIYYVKHPRAVENEFSINGSELPQGNYLCVEELISSGKYQHVISCCSSALINAKLMAGDSINCWAVGVEHYPFPSDNQKQQLLGIYKNLGVQIIDL